MRIAALILLLGLPLAAQMTVVGEGAGGGAPTDATYWLGSANGSLSAEIVVNDIASLEAAIAAYDFNDAANLTTGDIAAARMATNWGTAGTSACATTGGVIYDNATTVTCGGIFTDGSALFMPATYGKQYGIYFGSTQHGIYRTSGQTTRFEIGNAPIVQFSTFPGAIHLNSSLSSNLIQWSDGFALSGSDRGYIGYSGGQFGIGQTLSVPLLVVGGSQSILIQDPTPTTGITSVIFKGGAGQGTTPVFKIQDSSANPIVSIGDDVSSDIEIGYNAGANLTANTYNVLIGSGVFDNAASNGSNYNVMIGQNAGGVTSAANLVSNVLIGRNAGQAVAGSRNIMLGESAGLASTGSENVMIGRNTGGETTGGSNNIFLGSHAGRDETGSNTLIIDTIDRTSEALGRTGALLYGVMNSTASSQTLHMNAAVRATQSLEVGNVGALIYPPSATEPVDCTTSNDGSMYFDTTDQTMCVCANDGADEWQQIQDMTTDCSI